MDAHRGQLFVEGNRHGLDAGISIDNKHCHVVSGDDSWTFPIHDVTARRWQGNDFKLTLAGENFVFTAADPIRFTFDVVDQLDSGGSRRRPTARRAPRAPRKATTKPELKPVVAPPANPEADTEKVSTIWTDLAGGREASSLLGALAELNAGQPHSHTWEEGEESDDGALQICAECRQVFIDLIAAEESPKDPWIELT